VALIEVTSMAACQNAVHSAEVISAVEPLEAEVISRVAEVTSKTASREEAHVEAQI